MARVVVQPVWQQKHPTPSHGGWEFHFHPSNLSAQVTEKIAGMDVGLAGGPLAAWLIEPGLAIWIRSFVATVTSEQRQYTGLAGVVIAPAPGHEPAFRDVLPSVLAKVKLPQAAPWTSDARAEPEVLDVAPADIARISSFAPWASTLEAARKLAHAVVLGGPSPSPAPLDDRVVSLFGDLLSWIPADARCESRRGTFVEGSAMRAQTQPSARNLLHYLARAWVPPPELAQRQPDFARHVWRLVGEVAASSRSTTVLFDDLTQIAESWDAALDLERYLRRHVFSVDELDLAERKALFAPPRGQPSSDPALLWNRVLHFWGRGLLRVPAERIAGLLARRILVDHLFSLDSPQDEHFPRRYLCRSVFEGMLPNRGELEGALKKIMPSLFEDRGKP